MELNWTIEVILSFLSVIPGFVMTIKIIRKYILLKKYYFIIYISLSSFLMLWAIFQGLSLLFVSIPLHIWSYYIWIPFVFLLDLILDSMTGERIEPFKMAIITAVSTCVIYSSFESNAVFLKIGLYGEIGLIYGGLFQIFVLILLGFAGFGWMYYSLKLYHFTPQRMKRPAAKNVFGSLLIAIIAPGTTFLGINSLIPGINKLLFAIGIVLVVSTFVNEPRLMYVLPFKISRLYVIDKGGIPLFTHSWTFEKDSVQKALFSGMIIGIQSILHETLNKGDVKEIIVDESTLLIKSVDSFRFACVLVASKTSRTLRLALEDFAEQFRIKYGDKLEESNSPNTFKDASILIKECFPFVPE